MKEPRGVDLLKTMIELLADQEGLKITYEIKEGVKREYRHKQTDAATSQQARGCAI
jgi:hypothetical protein